MGAPGVQTAGTIFPATLEDMVWITIATSATPGKPVGFWHISGGGKKSEAVVLPFMAV